MIYDLFIAKDLKVKYFLIVLIFLILSLKSASAAHAQSLDIGLFPPIFQIETNPPSKIAAPLTIQNFLDTTTELTISLKPFTYSKSENGQISYLSDTASYPDPFLLQRVKILEDEQPVNKITLSPNEQKELSLEIDIPQNEPKGDYYFSILFSSGTENNNTDSTTLTQGTIVSNVLLSVGPLGKKQGFIQEFSAPFFVNTGPVPFTVRLKNTSDHYITPTGQILVSNMFGQNIGKVDLVPVNILSNSLRRIPDSAQNSRLAENPVALWPEKILFGLYTATLTISLSDKGPTFVKTLNFFAFPIEFLIGLLIVLGIVIFIALRVKNNLYKNNRKR